MIGEEGGAIVYIELQAINFAKEQKSANSASLNMKCIFDQDSDCMVVIVGFQGPNYLITYFFLYLITN